MTTTEVRLEWSVLDLLRYLRSRRRFLAIACGSALLISGLVSLILPKRFTATASLVIEPPAGMDPRSATALSPVYLDSLKTYESVISSNSLFLRGIDHLGIRRRFPASSVESLKRSVLRVSRPLNTRLIEIDVTLDDPVSAQQLASWIAVEGAALSRSIDAHSSETSGTEAEAVYQRAKERLSKQRAAFDDFTSAGAGLETEVFNYSELKYSVDRDRGDMRADLAADPANETAQRAKLAELDRQSSDLSKTIETTSGRLEVYRRRREALEGDLKDARSAFEAAQAKLEDIRTSAGFRGERLEVLDPGVVPQRPSSPNLPLNILVALVVSLVGSLSWLFLCFGLERAHEAREAVRRHW
jgi:uncharacterized protein involved in exopolysaccharide biosynthesis